MSRRGKDLAKLEEVIINLISGKVLDRRYKEHTLKGNYKGRRECHIESDWLLIYKLIDDFIIFERTGTHSDLFE
ncbi:TPA: type II toxin-antitoxin system mRNA interferase toxin, RelE/StbE family [bacterium]|nr:MAG: type II toxin-antitoxin system mRNA interferase toxin, RelE/StbE family [Candidatus Hydrogenedentes bacterium CG07_land_8_20_14_0_80_42_17]HBW47633.1 type II toxin-antitoxin system mRNA interferase toxin, RelE/StbE family [bacterium]